MSTIIDFFEYCDIIEKLNKWIEAYENGNPIVSDVVYDAEYQKLKQFERANPNEIEPNSPTRKVGASTTSKDDPIPLSYFTLETRAISVASSRFFFTIAKLEVLFK